MEKWFWLGVSFLSVVVLFWHVSSSAKKHGTTVNPSFTIFIIGLLIFMFFIYTPLDIAIENDILFVGILFCYFLVLRLFGDYVAIKLNYDESA